MAKAVRWTITVSEKTDLDLRRFLGSRGMKEGDLSKFVEEAVRWRVFDQTVEAIRKDNEDLPTDALDSLIDSALQEVRVRRREHGPEMAD